MIALQTNIQKFVKNKLDYAYEISFLSRVKCFGGNCGFSNELGYQLDHDDFRDGNFAISYLPRKYCENKEKWKCDIK